MKFKLVEDWDRLEEKINWTDEQVRDIIDMYTSQGLSLEKIAAKYNASLGTIRSLLMNNDIETRLVVKKYPIYLNTISYIGNLENSTSISNSISLEYKPSIKLGDYNVSEIARIAANIRKRITDKKQFNESEVLAFYMKLLHAEDREENIRQFINDISNIDSNQDAHKDSLAQAKRFPLLTLDDKNEIKDNDLVEFYSFDDKAKVWLTKIGSKVQEWQEPTTYSGKYLKELALQYYAPTRGVKNYIEVGEKYDLKNIIYLLFDKYGNKIDPINYAYIRDGIPYENKFNISSLGDIEKCFKAYGHDRDILYGYLDNKSRVVYVGITQNPSRRGAEYAESDKEKRAIAKALTENLIAELIIFKSYLPTTYSESSSKLLRYLEVEFAENIFKTYSPENKKKSYEELINAGTLNIDKPGKNQSRYIVNAIQNYIADLATQDLLTLYEYTEKLRSMFDSDLRTDLNSSKYSYAQFYLREYISNHKTSWKIDFIRKDVSVGKFIWLYPQIKSLDELNALIDQARISVNKKYNITRRWKEFHALHNQNTIDDLDDNIDKDVYK